ncbi:putative C6 finger domain protein [Aspergillus floccosus]
MSFTRKRAPLACNFCRSRKRRCDAQKPSCSNCIELEVQCQYDDGPSQRIDSTGGSREILNRLRAIEALLQSQSERITALSSENRAPSFSVHDQTSPASQQYLVVEDTHQYARPPQSSALSNLPPLTIPVKHKTSSTFLLTLPPVKSLVGDYPTDLFFRLESRCPLPPQLSLDQWPSPIPLDIERDDDLVSVFFSLVHPNHPILDRQDFERIYEKFVETGPDYNLESILCLVVLALGAVATAPPNPQTFQESPPGMHYIQHAMPTLISLSAWSFPSSILLPQALVLASVYFAYIVRPLQSWRLMHAASTILQTNRSGVENLDIMSNHPDLGDHVLRLFWSCFLVECDRVAELDLPRSGLQELTDNISLPRCNKLGVEESTYYLAEISIRRLLNRIHNTVYPRRKGSISQSTTTLPAIDDFSIQEVSSMGTICTELRSQLELWYSSIPETFRLGLEVDATDFTNRQSILRIRYFATRHIIYRPFLLSIVMHGSDGAPASMIEKAVLCIESCRYYIYHTTQVLARPSQYTWTFALSSLGAVIILTLASLCRDLRDFVPDIDELQTTVINNIRPWAFSSLEAVLSILEDMQKKRRLLSRV